MPWPAFIAELDDAQRYRQLRLGLWGSLGLTAVLCILVALGQHFDAVARTWLFFGLAGAKVALDVGALAALRLRRGLLPWMFANVVGDLALITFAVYLTGGALSPLFALYVVHLVVTALLSNAGVTLLVGAVAFLLYVAMALGSHVGAWPSQPPPVGGPGGLTWPYLLLLFGFAACAIGIPAVGAARLLDQLRQKQQALQRRKQALEEESRRRNQFMATLTHELRNPIHGICGLTDLLTQQIYGEINAKQESAIRQIRGSADGLLQLIEDHLQMAKDEAGRLEIHLGEVDLAELVPTAAQSIDWMVQAKHIQLDTEIEPGLPPLRSDRGKLNQVLVNLMTNAVKYTPDGGRITVLVRRQDRDRVSLSVKDTGQGIAPQELDRIFDPFHQVGGGAAGGVGLGLNLVKRLLHLLGGEIQVGSQLGQGTSFVISLPIQGEPRREPSDPEQRAVEARGVVVRAKRS
jgi:signal transduction histidine kinase